MSLWEAFRKIWRIVCPTRYESKVQVWEVRVSPGGDSGVIENIAVRDILCQDEQLMSIIAEPPYVYVLPAGKPLIGKYAIIWLYLNPELVSYSNLVYAIISAVRIPHTHSCYEGLVGVEVVPCLCSDNSVSDRIVRIVVHEGCYHLVEELDAQNIRKEKPMEGVSCGWYWDPNTVDNPR